MAKSTTRVTYDDIDVYGREDSTQAVFEYTDDLAVSNALICWLTSKIGDYIYQPQLGGILDRTLFKRMTQGRTNALREYFINAIESNFGGVISVENVIVDPDAEFQRYNIEISYRSLITGELNLVDFVTRPPVDVNSEEPVSVPYIGQNLDNFVKLKLPLMQGVIFKKDDITEKWNWGVYVLENLQETDYNFDYLFNLTKGP